ncbi:MAG: PAS domain-containing protein [Candidatus Brocadia sp.]|nr:PAS domain-containing protein [Candidatus Brocadia sp.]
MLATHIVNIFISLLYAGLGFFVFLRNPSSVINKRFCIVANVFCVWSFLVFFTLQAADPVLAAFRLKLVFCAAAFIPSAFFFFISVFPDRVERPIDRYFSIIFFIVSIVLAFSSSSIVETLSFINRLPQAKYGPLFPVFWSYFIVCMVYSLYVLYKKSIRFYGIKRLQIQYLYFGVAVSVLLGAITNFLLPAMGIWQVESFVPLVTIPIPTAVAYAIVKYHLMDISVVIKKSTVYAILSIILSLIYFAVGLVVSNILPVSEYTETVSNVISIIIMVLIFVPARESIHHFIENHLFHTKYSYPKILSNSTVMFSSIHDLDRLLRFAIQYLYDSVGIEKIAILIKDEKIKQYSLKAAINFSSKEDLFLPGDAAVVTWLCQNKTVLSREQLNRFSHDKLDRLLEKTLISMDVDSCIPILHGKDLFGIILLGKKVDKKVFTQEDIQMFLAFSGQLAMAANNACLYSGLKEAKTYRENILQSLKCGVITINNHEEVTLLNNEARNILGLESTSSTEMILNALNNDIYKLLKYTLKNNRDHTDIETFIERGSTRVPCSVTITQLKTESGEKLGALIILTDQTELKLLQVEKQHADRLAHLGSLASNIAHEIKNPLVAINTYFQLLPYKKDDPEFHSNFREIALKEIGRINRIIEDMLNLAKPSKLVIQHIDPHCVIMDTINLLKNDAAKKDIEITTMLDGNRCQLIADEDKVKQVFLNILQNSLDALSSKGHIQVSTYLVDNLSEFKRMAKEHSGSVFFSFVSSLSNNLSKQYFVIKISDNGTGIPAEKISHIFEPFFSNKDKGTGLGLAVVYRIIKDHEGGIYVESKEGIGTDFYIGLPVNSIGANSSINARSKDTDIFNPIAKGMGTCTKI